MMGISGCVEGWFGVFGVDDGTGRDLDLHLIGAIQN
jgi:hypothetical protein